MDDGGFHVFLGEVHQRRTGLRIGTGLVLAVEFIDILDELSVQQVQGDILGADTGALATVGAAGGHMESPDDMIHILFEGSCGCLLRDAGVGIVEHALFAGAGGTSVTASVATDATGQFTTPEFEALLGAHSLQLGNHIKAVAGLLFALLTDHLVKGNNLLALAYKATLQQAIVSVQGLVLIDGLNLQRVAVFLNSGNTVAAGSTNLLDVQHTVAGNTYNINIFTKNSVLLQQLLEGVAVAGLDESCDLAALAALSDQVLAQVRTGKYIENEILFDLLLGGEHGGGQGVEELTVLPTQNPVNSAVFQQLDGFLL